MSKSKKEKTAKENPITAEELITKSTKPSTTLPSAIALAELKKVILYNDSSPPRRVTVRMVLDMLSTHGYPCGTRRLDTVCQMAFGRTGFTHA
jgi:hypothetical protein